MKTRILCVLLCLLLAITGHTEEKAQPKKADIVREIEIRGNLRVRTEYILSLLRTRVGQPFDEKVWDQDWHTLTNTELFDKVRMTVPLGWPGGGTKLIIGLIEKPAYGDLTVKGVEEAKASKIRQGCAGFMGALDTPVVRKSLIAVVKEVQGQNTKVSLLTVGLRSHKQSIAGKEAEVIDTIRLVIDIQ